MNDRVIRKRYLPLGRKVGKDAFSLTVAGTGASIQRYNKRREFKDAMKRELVNILACPVCKGELKLGVNEENGNEVITGSLFCPRCNQKYPIVETIPHLLPPKRIG